MGYRDRPGPRSGTGGREDRSKGSGKEPVRDWLKKLPQEEGIKEEVTAGAVKRLLGQQLQTSRAAVNRLLDPNNDAVTLQALKRAAAFLGKHIHLELV